MRLIVVTAPDHDKMLAIGRDVPGVLRLPTRPDDQTDTDVASTVLERLGKDPVRAPARLPTVEVLVRWAHAWLLAHGMHTVVIPDAQLLSGPALTTMLKILNPVDTVLLVRAPNAEGLSWPGHRIEEGDWSDWQARISTPDDVRAVAPEVAPLTPADLPVCHFLTFRSRAGKLLSSTQAARVDKVYVTAFRAAEQALPTTSASIVNFLEIAIVRLASCAADALVVLYATQSAMFSRGWLMQVDPDVLWRDLPALGPHPPDDAWRRVTWLYDPESTAILTLSLLNVPEDTIVAFTVGEIRTCVSTGRLAHTALPQPARRNLAARLHELRDQPDETLFVTRKPLRAVRTHARRNLGIPIPSARATNAGPLTGPLSQLSIKLTSIGD